MEVAIRNRLLNNDSPAVPMRCLNELLYYGKDMLIHRAEIIDFIINNINKEDMAFMMHKHYIVHSIIEVALFFLRTPITFSLKRSSESASSLPTYKRYTR